MSKTTSEGAGSANVVPAHARSTAIDFLRGLAVSMVMLAHLPFSRSGFETATDGGSYPGPPIPQVLAHGHYGVQLFLVISGYCIHNRWARHGDLSARIDFWAFWRRRLTRLYPPYLVVMVLSVAIMLAAETLFPGSVPPISTAQLLVDVAVLLLLLQNLTGASTRVGNPPFWSLGLEEQLYLLYFPLLALRRNRGWRVAIAVTLVVTLAWLGMEPLLPAAWRQGWSRAGPAYWVAWTLGAMAAEAHVGILKLPAWTRSWSAFLVVLALGVCSPKRLQALLVTVSFFFLLRVTIASEDAGYLSRSWWAGWLVRLGKISYGVYLVHNLAFIVAKRLLVSVGTPAAVTLALRGAAGIAAGLVIYLALEKPFLRISKRISVPLRSSHPDTVDVEAVPRRM